MSSSTKYRAIIGIEIHAQLKTRSKIFCPDPVVFAAIPNTAVSPISLGHPGTLPSLNKRCVELAVMMGLALRCRIQSPSYFARKNYFYPDLPKGYQISQYEVPICMDGYLELRFDNGNKKRIGIERIQLEEDTGKSLHNEALDESLIDLNRAGIGLIEIVSKPDITTPEEAMLYVAEIRKLVRYYDICDGNMEEGSLRCDANVSVMPIEAQQFGTKVEIKNMNSISNVGKALAYEIQRQIQCLEKGEPIFQETRTWNEMTQSTIVLRRKETADDYRYFPEPDLPPLIITEEWLNQIKQQMPPHPDEIFEKYLHELQLPFSTTKLLTEEKGFILYYEELISHFPHYQLAANWLIGPVRSYLNSTALTIEQFPIPPKQLAELLRLIQDQKVNQTAAKETLFPALIQSPTTHPETLAKELNILMEHDDDLVTQLATQLIEKEQEKVEAYRKGKKGLLGFFVGQIMKETKGKADPKRVNQIVKELLENKH